MNAAAIEETRTAVQEAAEPLTVVALMWLWCNRERLALEQLERFAQARAAGPFFPARGLSVSRWTV